MPALFIDTALNGDLLPELSLTQCRMAHNARRYDQAAACSDVRGQTCRGVNCTDCKPPADWLEPNRVKPIPVPK